MGEGEAREAVFRGIWLLILDYIACEAKNENERKAVKHILTENTMLGMG
jgi:hypothetical protein